MIGVSLREFLNTCGGFYHFVINENVVDVRNTTKYDRLKVVGFMGNVVWLGGK